MKIALRALPGTYVTAENGGDDQGICHADRSSIGEWETFEVIGQPENRIALKTSSGRYLSAENGGGLEVHANRTSVGPWEQFSGFNPAALDSDLVLKTWNGTHFLGVGPIIGDPVKQLHARYTVPYPFKVVTVEADPVPVPGPTPGVIEVLHRDGLDFRNEHNQRRVICEGTNFLQFYRWMRGDNPDGSLYPGIDCDRVTLTMKLVPNQLGWPALDPETDYLFWNKLADFLTWKRSLGRRTELTVLCDMAVMNKTRDYMRRVVQQTYEVAQHYPEVLVEWINEVGHPTNNADPYDFTDIDRHGVLTSSGSSFSGGPVPEPYIDYCTPHLVRDNLGKMLADGNFGEQVYNSWPDHPVPTHRPMLTNEMIGADEVEKPGSRSNDPNVFREVARVMTSRNGGCFHATDAVYSRPLGPVQTECLAAFVEGFNDLKG